MVVLGVGLAVGLGVCGFDHSCYLAVLLDPPSTEMENS